MMSMFICWLHMIIQLVVLKQVVPQTTERTTVTTENPCFTNHGCENGAGCDSNGDCVCLDGFSGTKCDESSLQGLYNDLSTQSTGMTLTAAEGHCADAHKFMDNHVTQGYTDLITSVETSINILSVLNTVAAASADVAENAVVDMSTLTSCVLELTTDVFRGAVGAESDLIAKNTLESTIVGAEGYFVTMAQLMLDKWQFTKSKGKWAKIVDPVYFTTKHAHFKGVKVKGKDLPVEFQTGNGDFTLPFFETFNDKRRKKNVTVIVLTYPVSPYIYVTNPDVVGSSVMKILVSDDDGAIPNTGDDDDPSEFSVATDELGASSDSTFRDMRETNTDSGVYLSYVDTNQTAKGFLFEIKLKSFKICDTYCKYNTYPSSEDYDIYVKTKGRNRIMVRHPVDLRVDFGNQKLRIVLPPSSKDGSVKPLVVTTSCEDDRQDTARRRRKRSLSLQKHEFRTAVLAVNGLSNLTNWTGDYFSVDKFKVDDSKIEFKSNFFGVFSADMFFLAPSAIDFDKIFGNFSESLAESPYAFAAILIILILCAPLTVILRRLDKQDEYMWQFLPLKDNPTSASEVYFITVETSIGSDRQLKATVFINVIGEKGSSGTRKLEDGVRQNFKRGTSSHFELRTSEDLGNISSLQIWHDGVDERTSWHLRKVTVISQSSSQRYTFLSEKPLSLTSDNGKTWCTLQVLQPDIVTTDTLFYGLSQRKLFDDYLWVSLVKRPQFSRFNRVQRLWSLIALVFLSMIASAMWYDVPEGTNTLQTIVIGPIKLNYKQFYVGVMSALVTLPVSVVLVFVFRNRRYKGENSIGFYLPWWSIFIAYALVIAAVGASGTFVFLYSLDWGGDKTLEWIVAFVLSIFQSILVMEPTKAILFAILIACLFKRIASKELCDLSTPIPSSTEKSKADDLEKMEESPEPEDTSNYPTFPGDEEESSDQALLRHLVQLDKRLWSKLQEWLGIFLYVILVSAICSHSDVPSAFRQNEQILNTLANATKPNTTADIYDYLRTTFTRAAYPKWWETEDDDMLRPAYVQWFMLNTYNYRFTLTRLRQLRVRGSCSIHHTMNSSIDVCTPSFNEETEETRNFCPFWETYNDTGCFDENEEFHYSFLNSRDDQLEPVEDLPYTGTHGTYGAAGYYIDLGPKQSLVLRYVNVLQENNWIDRQTRAVFADLVSYNANTRLFSQIKVVFELPTTGDVAMTTHVWSANFYPYQSPLDYVIMGLQFIFIIVWCVRFVLYLVFLFKQRCSALIYLEFYVKLLELGFGLAAVVFCFLRINATISAITKLRTSVGRYVSFESIWLYDRLYLGCLAVVLFIIILDLLRPLEFNYHFFTMIQSLKIARGTLAAFTVIIMLEITSFACLIHLTIGRNYVLFKNFWSSVDTLLTVLLAMRKYNSEEFNDALIKVYFGLYTFSLTITLVNVFITILTISQTEARAKIEDGTLQYDKELNEHFWSKVDKLIEWLTTKFCFSGMSDDDDLDKHIRKLNIIADKIARLDIARQRMAAEMMIKMIHFNSQKMQLDCLNVQRNQFATKYIFGFLKTGETLVILTIPILSCNEELAITCEIVPCLRRDVIRKLKTKFVGKSYMFLIQNKIKLKGCVLLEILDKPEGKKAFDTVVAKEQDETKWTKLPSYKCASGIQSTHRNIPTYFSVVHTGRKQPLTNWRPLEMYQVTTEGGSVFPSYDPSSKIIFAKDTFTDTCLVSIRTRNGPTTSVLNVMMDEPALLEAEIELSEPCSSIGFLPDDNHKGKLAECIIVCRPGPQEDWERMNSVLNCTNGTFKFIFHKDWTSLETTVKVSKIHWVQQFKLSSYQDIPLIKAIVTVSQVKDIAVKWPQIISILGIAVEDVFKVKDEILCQEEKCFMVLEKWVMSTTVTFAMLIDLLITMGFKITAEQIRQRLEMNQESQMTKSNSAKTTAKPDTKSILTSKSADFIYSL